MYKHRENFYSLFVNFNNEKKIGFLYKSLIEDTNLNNRFIDVNLDNNNNLIIKKNNIFNNIIKIDSINNGIFYCSIRTNLFFIITQYIKNHNKLIFYDLNGEIMFEVKCFDEPYSVNHIYNEDYDSVINIESIDTTNICKILLNDDFNFIKIENGLLEINFNDNYKFFINNNITYSKYSQTTPNNTCFHIIKSNNINNFNPFYLGDNIIEIIKNDDNIIDLIVSNNINKNKNKYKDYNYPYDINNIYNYQNINLNYNFNKKIENINYNNNIIYSIKNNFGIFSSSRMNILVLIEEIDNDIYIKNNEIIEKIENKSLIDISNMVIENDKIFIYYFDEKIPSSFNIDLFKIIINDKKIILNNFLSKDMFNKINNIIEYSDLNNYKFISIENNDDNIINIKEKINKICDYYLYIIQNNNINIKSLKINIINDFSKKIKYLFLGDIDNVLFFDKNNILIVDYHIKENKNNIDFLFIKEINKWIFIG